MATRSVTTAAGAGFCSFRSPAYPPYLLSHGCVRCASRYASTNGPATGMNVIHHHHPDIPASCNLRTAAASSGTHNAMSERTMKIRVRIVAVSTKTPRSTRTANKKNHQYSLREARPLKSTYLRKQVETDSPNVIDVLFVVGELDHVLPQDSAVDLFHPTT
jgi:hypothetical protein